MVKVLLSTYNGEKYLKAQLDSLYSQVNSDFEVIARDDGSSDTTVKILNSYDIKLLDSKENLGAKCSFSALLKFAVENSDDEYFMFCDQDDIWVKDKIEKTLIKMKEIEKDNSNLPLLIHSDLELVDGQLNLINKSFWKNEYINPSMNTFSRLLMQNTITGCTVMINRKLAELAIPIPNEIIMHDWWLGLLASKFGKIAYIDKSLIKYRQHDENTIGAKGFSYFSILLKSYTLFTRNELYIKHLNLNIKQAKSFLNIYKSKLSNESILMLEGFITIENKSFFQKRVILLKYKLLKQGLIRNIGLLLKI